MDESKTTWGMPVASEQHVSAFRVTECALQRSTVLNVSDGDIGACLFPHLPLGNVAHDDADLLFLSKERLSDDPARIPRSTKYYKHRRAA
jgi:hypothetical protein